MIRVKKVKLPLKHPHGVGISVGVFVLRITYPFRGVTLNFSKPSAPNKVPQYRGIGQSRVG
jgi:hypothetical protein